MSSNIMTGGKPASGGKSAGGRSAAGGGSGAGGRRRPPVPDGTAQHREWLSLVEVSGPFLSLPVLRKAWPTLDPLDKQLRERLRVEHAGWQEGVPSRSVDGQRAWVDWVLRELLGWADALVIGEQAAPALEALAVDDALHDTRLVPSFALVEPGTDVTAGDELKPDAVRLLGVVCPPGQSPTGRVAGSGMASSPSDRLAQLCRHHSVELGLATDGRWWVLVWAPRGGVTTTAVFDAVSWQEAAERHVVRAFVSLLCRRRFFGVPDDQTLVKLLDASKGSQEDITEALGVQVRQAVELLVAAFGRSHALDRDAGGKGLRDVDAHDVYRGAVAVMMRVVFLLYAEERNLLPADNELYSSMYSAGRLCAELEQQLSDGATEDDLEQSTAAWHRLLALFGAVYHGVDHPRLEIAPHGGSLFDPAEYPWLPLTVDDRTVLHVLRAVQYVEIGSGRLKERRSLSFRSLDVEQIGYVYEGLLSYDGYRAEGGVVVGLVGKEGLEAEVALADLEDLASRFQGRPLLAAQLADKHKATGIGSAKAIEQRLAPLDGAAHEDARKKLLAVTRGDYPTAERLLPFFGIIRMDLRGLPVVILEDGLYVTESPLRKNTGTHYTPGFLAKEVADNALEPLVYSPGPLQTADQSQWKLRSSKEILDLKVADIAMGSAAFLVAAARYLGDRLVEAWSAEGDERATAYMAGSAERGMDADTDELVVDARRQVIEHCLYGVDINPMAVEMAKLSLWLVSMDPKRPFTFLDDRLASGDSLLGITSLEQLEYMHLDPTKGREIHRGDLFKWTAGVRELVEEAAAERRKISQIDGSIPEGVLAKLEIVSGAKKVVERASLFADFLVGANLYYAGRGGRGPKIASEAAAKLASDISSGEATLDYVQGQLCAWLAVDGIVGADRRSPLHWPLVFPEVFKRGGFDAIIGNPPFLGGMKISNSMGSTYRKFLSFVLVGSETDRADLASFFVRRAGDITSTQADLGFVVTHSVTQATSKEIGLDHLERRGWKVYAGQSRSEWPSRSANVFIVRVWLTRATVTGPVRLDGTAVARIGTALTVSGRTLGEPARLAANSGQGLQGSKPSAKGFFVSEEQREEMLANDSRNADVITPYLTGSDLNVDPECAPGRWIINFRNWPKEVARTYVEPFRHVAERVPEERRGSSQQDNPSWWQFGHPAMELYRRIDGLARVIVFAETSATLMPALVAADVTFSNTVVVLPFDDFGMLCVLSSSVHHLWATSRGSSMKNDPRYQAPRCFETFPLPIFSHDLQLVGERLHSYRRKIMDERGLGLTKIYGLVSSKTCEDADIVGLRKIHRMVDEQMFRAYGWIDGLDNGLSHGFHLAGAHIRYTVGPDVQREVLDRLLELNRTRYSEEVAAGLHEKAVKNVSRVSPRAAAQPQINNQDELDLDGLT